MSELYVIEVKAVEVKVGDLIKYRQATLAGMRTVESAVTSVEEYDYRGEDLVEVLLENGDGFDWEAMASITVSRRG